MGIEYRYVDSIYVRSEEVELRKKFYLSRSGIEIVIKGSTSELVCGLKPLLPGPRDPTYEPVLF